MKIAILGAGVNTLTAIDRAHRQGMEVVVVDCNTSAPGFALADETVEANPADTTAVIEALRDKNISLCLAEPASKYMVVMGAVNDAFSLPGVTSQTASFCSDKYVFHNRMRNRKLRPGHCYLINDNNLYDPMQMTYPAIIKPRFGNGGREVHYLEKPEELYAIENKFWGEEETEIVSEAQASQLIPRRPKTEADVLNSYHADAEAFSRRLKRYMDDSFKEDCLDVKEEDFILEEAFSGTEFGIDGVVEGCNFELVLVRRKILTPPPARVAVGYTSVVMPEEMRLVEIINEYMSKVTEALGLKDCMLNADLIIQGRKCTAIEISLYPALSHLADELIPMVTGVDIYKEFLVYSQGEAHNFSPLQMKRMTLRFFNMENCFIHAIPDPEELDLPEKVKIRKWICNMKMLDFMGTIRDTDTLLKRGYYILEGPSDKALEDAVNIINNAFEIK